MTKDDSRGRGGGGRGRGGGIRGRGGRPSATGPGSSETPPKPVPANWPPHITYITTPAYVGISIRQRQLLQTQPTDVPGAAASTLPLPEVPSILRFGPSPLVAIRSISDPTHPACGQRGLFAARNLAPGSFILPYLGVCHRGNVSVGGARGGTNLHNKRESDYDLWLDREADVAVDADRQGNEARFVNDYRGTGKPRPNAEFREVWDPRRGERGMAVFVLPAGKRAALQASSMPSGGGIAKDEEILVSYGKGFWEMRQKEAGAKEKEKEKESEKGGGGDGEREPKAGEGGKDTDAAAALATPGSPDRQGVADGAPEEVLPGRADVQSITDKMGSLKVVAKLPRNPAWK